MRKTKRKVAIVHDFLYCYAGADGVLEQILNVYPEADLFSLFDFLPARDRGFLKGKPVTTTFIQRLPFARSRHRMYLPLMPLAIEQLDLSAYDLVISSSYVAAKGILTHPQQLHICYCHSPVRFAWDLHHQYLAESGLKTGVKSMVARAILHYIRNWDIRSAGGVDHFITNSQFIARRIQKVYRRSAIAVYPPVDIEQFTPCHEKDDFYVTASRMVPYKRIELIVEAFNRMPDRKLVVIGDGPDFKKIKARAARNVTMLGQQPAEALKRYMQRARAFVFAAEEDFGIVAVEAQACGTPVIAFGRGGLTETVLDEVTGIFFHEQSAAELIRAVKRFEARAEPWDTDAIRANAELFSGNYFREELRACVESKWDAFNEGMHPAKSRSRRGPVRRVSRLFALKAPLDRVLPLTMIFPVPPPARR